MARNNASISRFVRGRRWKLYEDGRLYDLLSDRDEDSPFLLASDNEERSNVRTELMPVFDMMKT